MLVVNRTHLRPVRMEAGDTGYSIPAGDGFELRRHFKNFDQGFAVHVVTNGKTKQGQQGRADIQQACAVNNLILTDARPLDDKDSMMAMFCSRAGGLVGKLPGPPVIAMESMV